MPRAKKPPRTTAALQQVERSAATRPQTSQAPAVAAAGLIAKHHLELKDAGLNKPGRCGACGRG